MMKITKINKAITIVGVATMMIGVNVSAETGANPNYCDTFTVYPSMIEGHTDVKKKVTTEAHVGVEINSFTKVSEIIVWASNHNADHLSELYFLKKGNYEALSISRSYAKIGNKVCVGYRNYDHTAKKGYVNMTVWTK